MVPKVVPVPTARARVPTGRMVQGLDPNVPTERVPARSVPMAQVLDRNVPTANAPVPSDPMANGRVPNGPTLNNLARNADSPTVRVGLSHQI